MKMSWLLGSEWNKVRCPGVFKKIVKWLKVVCGLEICVCVPLTKGNKFLPHKNGCHLPWENISMIFYPVVDCFGWTAGGTGVQNQNQKQNRWWSTARSARRPQNWGREAGQTVLFILKERKRRRRKNNYLVKILGWYTNFLNIFAGWYTERETFATISSQEISCRWKSPKIQRHKTSKCLIRER